MKKFLLIIAFIAVGFVMQAQTVAEIEETVARFNNPSTPCNQGGEAFNDFIAKFSTDQEFLNSRLKLTEAQKSEYAELLVPENFTAKLPFAKDDDMFYQAWGELQFNSAYLDCGWVDSYCTHTFEFKRIGGKWYLAKVVVDE
ncbi:MAG: hypothetical protein IJC40_04340 [Muribaculaceae bacterium]|nr:hypothetical protein [Muribaculaceae bacterium]